MADLYHIFRGDSTDMAKLFLEWQDDRQEIGTRTIDGSQTSKSKPATIGRNPDCTIAVQDVTKTTSNFHLGIFFDPKTNLFYLINLTADRPEPNLAMVDGKMVCKEQVPLHIGSQVRIGKKIRLRVKEIKIQEMCKCSHHPIKHVLPLQYLHGNCPIDGSVVMEVTAV